MTRTATDIATATDMFADLVNIAVAEMAAHTNIDHGLLLDKLGEAGTAGLVEVIFNTARRNSDAGLDTADAIIRAARRAGLEGARTLLAGLVANGTIAADDRRVVAVAQLG